MLQMEISEAMTHFSNHNMQFDSLWLRVESTGYVKCILLKIQITISQISVCTPRHQLWVWPLAEILWIQYLIWKFLKIGTTIHSDPLMSYKNIFGQNFIELILLNVTNNDKKNQRKPLGFCSYLTAVECHSTKALSVTWTWSGMHRNCKLHRCSEIHNSKVVAFIVFISFQLLLLFFF